MKKIGLISDIHGNLQALQVALNYLKQQNCDEIIHTGDVVDIGAQSGECLQLLLQNKVLCILGNHDLDFLSDSWQHKHLSHVSGEHKRFVFRSIQNYKQTMEKLPLCITRICGGKTVVFEHYCRLRQPLSNGYVYNMIANPPTAERFDEMYSHYNCDVVFFGHKHEPCDIVGKRLYVDVGSVGCHPEPLACGIIIEYDQTNFRYTRFALPYNQAETERKMTEGNLPDGRYLFNFYYLHKDLPRKWTD